MTRTIGVLLPAGHAAAMRIAAGPGVASRLERGDVDGLRPLVAGLGVVGDLRALSERLEAARVDAGVVDEQVLATLVRRDEAEALVVVEPLNGSGCHVISSTALVLRTRRLPKRRLRALNTLVPDAYDRPNAQTVPHETVRKQRSVHAAGQRNVSAVMRLTSVTTSAGMPARLAAAMIASGLGAS